MLKNLTSRVLEKKISKMVHNIETKIIPKILKEVGKEIAGGLPGTNGASSGVIQREMTKKNKSGREYLVNVGIGGRALSRKRKHTSSTPSEFPAVISGKLRKGTGSRVTGRSRVYVQTSGVPYASKMNARNEYLEKGVKMSRQRIRAIIKRNMKLI